MARCTVAHLMRQMGLKGIVRGKSVRTTISDKAAPCPLDRVNRDFKALGADVERAWHSAGATAATRKRIIRTLIEEIIVRVVDDALDLVIRWAGGDHTPLRVRKNRVGEHRWSTDADVVELVAVLARQLPDKAIAAILNRAGKKTGRATAGPARASACCAITAGSLPIARVSGPSAARSPWRKRPRRSR